MPFTLTGLNRTYVQIQQLETVLFISTKIWACSCKILSSNSRNLSIRPWNAYLKNHSSCLLSRAKEVQQACAKWRWDCLLEAWWRIIFSELRLYVIKLIYRIIYRVWTLLCIKTSFWVSRMSALCMFAVSFPWTWHTSLLSLCLLTKTLLCAS